MSKLVIVHADCSDGFGAAWVFHKKFPDAKFLSVKHGGEPPYASVNNREVYMCDFCYDPEVMTHLNILAKSLVVLDHHKSAMAKCGHLPFCTFDMSRSGAMMAWDYCFPNKPAPKLIQYVQDRDLWTKKLPCTDQICSAIDAHAMEFWSWDRLGNDLEDPNLFEGARTMGVGIVSFNEREVMQLAKRVHNLTIGGYKFLAVNTSSFRSEVCAFINKTYPAAAAYSFDGSKWVFSLRSTSEVDVSEIAAKYPGGGGHAKSAGFSIEDLKFLGDC